MIYLIVYSSSQHLVNPFLTQAQISDSAESLRYENPKRMIRKFCFTLAVLSTALLSMVSAQQTAKVTASGIGYLEYLPQGYHSNSNNYPVVISLHGIKEKGSRSTDRNRVLADLAKVDNVGLPKYVRFGERYPFILISPQLKGNYGTWPGSYVMQVLNHVKKYLRIDERRIYLTGLSLGGFGVWRTAGENPEVFAAIAPICPGGNALNKANDIAAANLPIWGFHGSNDRIVSYHVTTKMINAVNSAPRKPNPLAKATIFHGQGHIIWDQAYQRTNLLDWMLSHRKGSAPPRDDDGRDDDDDYENEEPDDDEGNENGTPDDKSNKAPVVEAGHNRTITLPANAVTVDGRANDADGKIISYHWSKISGRYARLNQAHRARLIATRLQEGTYVFRLTVKDNKGAASSDDVEVIVKRSRNDNKPNKPREEKPRDNNSGKNSRPVAYTGPDRVITLPTNSITINSQASDKDGHIVSYEWAKTYGRRASLSGANTPTVNISNLERGIYIFRLRVTDNDGAIRDDYFKITVNDSDKADNRSGRQNETRQNEEANNSRGRSNSKPQAYAGRDRVLNWPDNSININAQTSDKDGKIVSYHWAKTYGRRASLSGERSSHVRISNLQPGIYIFRLSVRDNDGAIDNDYFKITVRD